MKEEKNTEQYLPSTKIMDRRHEVYKYLEDMIELKGKSFPHFSNSDGQTSFLGYIDRNERILNGYTMSREMQGKDDWQSNFMDNITRAKLRAMAAGVGLNVPEMRYVLVNKDGIQGPAQAEILKETVRSTFLDGNPTMQSFLEVWQMLSHGVLIEYDGYLSGGAKRKVVTAYNTETGEVETEEKYIKVQGKPFNAIISPNDFYWWDMFKRDIQDQPRLAWLQRYNKSEIEIEFSKFPNYKYIKNKEEVAKFSLSQETLHYTAWSNRVDQKDYEVFRYYSKEDDAYEVWINGVLMLQVPLLWGEDIKYYPFAKTISEPFANAEFFVGMALPHILDGYQDTKNTIVNTLVDKLYRSLVPPMLVGLQNKDLLDVESELVNQDNRYYVPDVNAVKPFPYQGVQQGDLVMLNLMDQGIDRLSVDVSQQGQQGSGVTAREVVLADARAKQIKGILFMFLEDLWLQKNKLRIRTVVSHYLKDKALGETFKDQTITAPGTTLPGGEKGTLDIHIAPNTNKTLSPVEIGAREDVAQRQGLIYKLVSIPKDWLEGWDSKIQVVTETLYNQDKIQKGDQLKEEIQTMATVFPEFFVSNKEKYIEETLELYGKSLDEYNPPAEPQPTQPPMQSQEQPQQLPADIQGQMAQLKQ